MGTDITHRARAAFKSEMAAVPPLSRRGGNALDSYDLPPPFDPNLDQPTDAYLEANHWGIAHLDPVSWKHYLPRLVEYAIQHMVEPTAMPIEALLASLRPPDRDPPRFGALSPEQRGVLVALLDTLAFDDKSSWKDSAMLALEEYWAPGSLYGRDR